MQKYLFLFLFVTITSVLSAQQPVELEGKILADSLEYTFINIINKTAHRGTTNDPDGHFASKCNLEMVEIEAPIDYLDELRGYVENHLKYTNS